MIYLRRGITEDTHPDRADWIVSLQTIMAANGSYLGDFTPSFGPKTDAAFKKSQRILGLNPDGKLGKGSLNELIDQWGWDPPDSLLRRALVEGDIDQQTFDQLADTEVELRAAEFGPGVLPGWKDPAWPQPSDLDGDGRADLTYLGKAGRQKVFGPLSFRIKDATKGTVDIDDAWEAKFVRTVVVPQLIGKTSYGKVITSGRVRFHKAVIPQLLGAFQEIEDKKLLDFVLTWGGSYVPRLIRGSTTTLSNHAFAVAFDINMRWNGLGKQPALVGLHGEVRSLVPIFERWGFFWGGWYKRRKDGMHFEAVKVLPRAEVVSMATRLQKWDHIESWLRPAA